MRIHKLPFLACAAILCAGAQQRLENPYVCEGVARDWTNPFLEETSRGLAERAALPRRRITFARWPSYTNGWATGGSRILRENYSDGSRRAGVRVLRGLSAYLSRRGRDPALPEAEKHLIAGLKKLLRLQQPPDGRRDWDTFTAVA